MKPYYEAAGITIYHGSWSGADTEATVMVTDPPFGIGYRTGAPRRAGNARSIAGDSDVETRDVALGYWEPRPALVFGSPKAPEPYGVRARLVWDQGGALGMGDLSLPWKPSWQMIYVVGGPWVGRRDCGSVLRYPPVQSVARVHPNEKPVGLLQMLLAKCIGGPVLDPFMGSGSTLVAAKAMGRKAVGFELEERYCEVAARRLAQEVLSLGGVE